MDENIIESEIRRKLRTSTIMLLRLSEESERSGISLDSIKHVQQNLEALTKLLERAKDYTPAKKLTKIKVL